MKHVDLAVFDLDNTLYDWYASFLPAFYAMVDVAAELLNCDEELLLNQLKAVHVKHHDVEHPYALFETAIVQARVKVDGSKQVWQLLDPAFHAFNKVRKSELRLFPNVRETLDELKRRRIRLIAFTDSKYFAAVGRIARLELSDVFERLYCREKSISELPASPFEGYRAEPIYNISATKVSELPAHESKPNPQVLQDIVLREQTDVTSTAYIGDSLAKDVLMARRAGCFAIWAQYGVFSDQEMYSKLVRVSHWSSEDVIRERRLALDAATVAPDFVCQNSIKEVLDVLSGPVQTAATDRSTAQ
jgi:phosphoglycolate phosphatase-like HAD superfamily hydrolase